MTFSPINTTPHILQTGSWGAFKAFYDWEPVRLHGPKNQSVLVLFKALVLGLTVAYVPKMTLVDSAWEEMRALIEDECRKRKAVFLQIECDLEEPYDQDALAKQFPTYIIDEETIQPRSTILIDISLEEDAILAAMKQKTRYNIRLAERKGVKVELSDDLSGFYEHTQITSARDGFAVHAFSYYQNAFDIFTPKGECVLLKARFEEKALAYLMLFIHGERAWYFYGASDDENRNLMPTYLLQWEAIRYAKARGAKLYDLWGIPDASEDQLEAQFTERSDGLWGVYRFKRGFGGKVSRTAPAFVKVYMPLLYKAYRWLKKRRGGDEHASL